MSDRILIPPKQLKPHPINERIYMDREDPELEASIKKHGIMQALVATKKRVILSGHRRWAIAMKLKLKEIPVEIKDVGSEIMTIIELNRYRIKTTGEKVKEVEVLDQELKRLGEEAMKAGKSADGKAGGRGKKSETLPQNEGEGFGYDDTDPDEDDEKKAKRRAAKERERNTREASMVGMSPEQLRKVKYILNSDYASDEIKEKIKNDKMAVDRAYREVKKLESSAAREERRKAQPQVSDQFIPQVITGDCTVKLAELKEESIHLVLTDPPYAISGANKMTMRGDRVENAEFGKWDELGYEDYLKLTQKVMRELYRVLVPGGSLYWFTDRLLISDCWSIAAKNGFSPRNVMTWGKTNPAPNTRGNFASATEMFIYCVKGKNPTFNEMDAGEMWNLWMGPKCTSINERTDHPTQKPLWLFEKAIQISSNPGDVVLDPFAGAGTTGEAAWKHNRKSILIEKSEDYVTRLISVRMNMLERKEEADTDGEDDSED